MERPEKKKFKVLHPYALIIVLIILHGTDLYRPCRCV